MKRNKSKDFDFKIKNSKVTGKAKIVKPKILEGIDVRERKE